MTIHIQMLQDIATHARAMADSMSLTRSRVKTKLPAPIKANFFGMSIHTLLKQFVLGNHVTCIHDQIQYYTLLLYQAAFHASLIKHLMERALRPLVQAVL